MFWFCDLLMLITGTLNSCRKRTKFIMDLFEFAYNLYLMDPGSGDDNIDFTIDYAECIVFLLQPIK